MPVPDMLIIGVAGGLTMLTSGISIGCLIARDRMRGQRDEARAEAETFEAHYLAAYENWQKWRQKAENADARARAANHERNEANALFNRYRAAEPARFEAYHKAKLVEHLRNIAPLGNTSPLRAAKRAEKRLQKAA